MSQHNNIQTGGRQFAGQKFTSVEDVQNYIKGFGVAVPLILIIIQAFQVVIPVLAGIFGMRGRRRCLRQCGRILV